MANYQGAQAHLLQDILDYLSDSELLDVIDYTYRNVICDELGGRAWRRVWKEVMC